MFWIVLAVYWVLAGLAAVMVGRPTKDLRVEGVVFLLGGFIVPARLIAKLIS